MKKGINNNAKLFSKNVAGTGNNRVSKGTKRTHTCSFNLLCLASFFLQLRFGVLHLLDSDISLLFSLHKFLVQSLVLYGDVLLTKDRPTQTHRRSQDDESSRCQKKKRKKTKWRQRGYVHAPHSSQFKGTHCIPHALVQNTEF